jgi:hypothetical protein
MFMGRKKSGSVFMAVVVRRELLQALRLGLLEVRNKLVTRGDHIHSNSESTSRSNLKLCKSSPQGREI